MDTISEENIISINVGGTVYMTTLNLICRYRNSRLCQIVLEKLKAVKDIEKDYNKKEIFIDRNGNRFEYILDFLRDGVLICENDINVLTRILIEAVYFKLFSLIKVLKKKIRLLYSNIGNNVNKNVFKSIINTIEEKKKNNIKTKSSISRKLNKLSGHISNYNELKYCNAKKKKNHNVRFLSNINILNELNKQDNHLTPNDEIHSKGHMLISNISGKNCKYEKEIVCPIERVGDKLKKDIKRECSNDRKTNSQENLTQNISYMPTTNAYTKSKIDDCNITNNFTNDTKKLNHIKCMWTNSLLKDEEEKKEVPQNHLLLNENLKNEDQKNVSFSENKSIFFYGKKDEIKLNGIENMEDSLNEIPKKYTNVSNFNSANYSMHSSITNYTSCINYANPNIDVNEGYKYNSYKCNNMNSGRGEILVYSDIDDIEETSPFPILSNVNLGEQIFSTTVDF